ncbi:hypothetical protein [Cellulomonas shaoxiangyii]|uniref:Uncharacterized protein n=1 Tax=Cellulomonas shaoxiangyii TaxID=2566013 RepID=A0A4P7SNC3_9CELL|nr:hypothetical protein [Cellulomonas shaoxiangyii]QCB95037.1 hypothetical protein E5225_17180 [Cellulomonas shaoxiangyii]TGY86366.1 hypothetical protein E5226_02265 [Cellulomonas shaoxiangyii]
MDVAALIISAVALLVAALSTLYTRRQARAADETAAIERARRYDERTPELDIEIEPLSRDRLRRHQRLVVRLASSEALTGVDVEIHDAPGLSLSPDQDGVIAGAPGPIVKGSRRARPGEVLVSPGQAVTWQTEVTSAGSGRPGRARLVVSAVRGDEVWVIHREVRVPPLPPRITTSARQR